jgi:hypothetical protein
MRSACVSVLVAMTAVSTSGSPSTGSPSYDAMVGFPQSDLYLTVRDISTEGSKHPPCPWPDWIFFRALPTQPPMPRIFDFVKEARLLEN